MLYFNFKPLLCTYLHWAYPFGLFDNAKLPSAMLNWNVQLVFPKSKHSEDSIHSHFFHLYPSLTFTHYAKAGIFDIKLHIKDAKPVAVGKDFGLFLKYLLKHRRYALMYVDYFYIPGTFAYAKKHFRHDLLVIGDDAKAGCFKGALYVGNNNLGAVDIPYADLLKAFSSELGRGEDCAPYCRGDLLASIASKKGKAIFAPLDVRDIRTQLTAYMESSIIDPGKVCDENIKKLCSFDARSYGQVSYGRAVYADIAEYLAAFTEGSRRQPDLRVTRLLWEHKRLMRARLTRLIKEGVVSSNDTVSKWRNIESKAQAIHIKAVAARKRSNPKILAGVSGELRELESQEAEAIRRLLKTSLCTG